MTSFKNAAKSILEKSDVPLTPEEITKKAFDENLIKSN